MSEPQGSPTTTDSSRRTLRARQKLGKYRVIANIGKGGFAQVYSALDTVEGVRVALKVPHGEHVDQEMLDLFKQEVRLVAKLDHPNILPIKNADFIDGRFVVATKLGKENLGSRLTRRISVSKSLVLIEQMLAAVGYAHELNILHCDLKPDNFILFDDDLILLSDFGIAKISRMTIEASGSGTVGYMAPEQAMGRPNKRSDVFSLGLMMYRMLAGQWPEYPFAWPPPGAINLRRKRVHPDLIRLIRKAISPQPRDRFADAIQLQRAFEAVQPAALRNLKRKIRG